MKAEDIFGQGDTKSARLVSGRCQPEDPAPPGRPDPLRDAASTSPSTRLRDTGTTTFVVRKRGQAAALTRQADRQGLLPPFELTRRCLRDDVREEAAALSGRVLQKAVKTGLCQGYDPLGYRVIKKLKKSTLAASILTRAAETARRMSGPDGVWRAFGYRQAQHGTGRSQEFGASVFMKRGQRRQHGQRSRDRTSSSTANGPI